MKQLKPNYLSKEIIKEIAWLLGYWAFSFALVGGLIGYRGFWSTPIEFQMHNTYWVFNTVSITIPFFIAFSISITVVRLLASRFQNPITTGVLGLLSTVWLLQMALIVNMVTR